MRSVTKHTWYMPKTLTKHTHTTSTCTNGFGVEHALEGLPQCKTPNVARLMQHTWVPLACAAITTTITSLQWWEEYVCCNAGAITHG